MVFITESEEAKKAREILKGANSDKRINNTAATVGLAYATLAQVDASLAQVEILDRIACGLDRIAEALENNKEE